MAFFGRSPATQNPASRRIFYWCLAASYLTIASSVIFLTLGYRYSFPDSGFFYTGSVNFKVEPSDADIFINRKEPSVRHIKNFINDSRHITGLRSGTHVIEASAPGYKPWRKEIGVKSGFATEFWNVILLRENYVADSLPVINPARVFFAPSGDTLAYAQNESYIDFSGEDQSVLYIPIVNVEDRSVERTYAVDSVQFTSDSTQNIEWSTDTRFLSVPVQHQEQLTTETTILLDEDATVLTASDYAVLDREFVGTLPDLGLDTDQGSLPIQQNKYLLMSEILESRVFAEPLSEPIEDDTVDSSPITKLRMLRWHPKLRNLLYVLADNRLFSVDFSAYNVASALPLSTILIREIATDILAYDFADDGLFVLRSDGSISRSRDFEVQSLKPFAVSSIELAAQSTVRLVVYDGNRLMIVSDDLGELEIYNQNNDLLEQAILPIQQVVGAQFSNDGKKVMIHTDRSAHVYFTRDWVSQPARLSNTLYAVLETEGQINSISWTPDYEHFVVAIDQGLYLAELDNRSSYRVEQIFQRQVEDENVYLDRKNFTLYYSDIAQNASIEDQIILKSINFPYKK